MNIRKRLTLWHSGFLVVVLLLLIGVLYNELLERRTEVDDENVKPESAWREAGEIAVFYGIPAVAVLLFGSSWLIHKLLAPITSLTEAAERIHAQNLKEQIPLTGRGDELDRLTEVFNAMTARLDASFTQIREFTLNASHELKTPLTIMRGEIESRLRTGEVSAADSKCFASQLDEIARLTRIVDGLALLSKADAGQMLLAREPVALDELVRESVMDAQLLGGAKRLKVELTACDATVVLGDRHRLRQLLLNLTDNATKYAAPDGRVTIALRNDQVTAEVTITNTGIGITPDKLERVFDRFYRGGTANDTATEGSGLGLSIAEWIVKAHGGNIRLASEPGVSTAATFTLPVDREPGRPTTRRSGSRMGWADPPLGEVSGRQE